MIGIVIPAHDEVALIERCLVAALNAARHAELDGETVEIVVVLDTCSDGTLDVVLRYPVSHVALEVRNVGAARAAGAQHMLARGARWLAFTDADSQVADDWLVQQLRQGSDVVCGTVSVDDWSDHPGFALELQEHFLSNYDDTEGHSHVHGANLGVSPQAYWSVGGFSPLASSEDVSLVRALESIGAHIAWSCAPRVITSARRLARAPLGFANAICLAVVAMRSTQHRHRLISVAARNERRPAAGRNTAIRPALRGPRQHLQQHANL